jgi:nicotinamidase-related amidase
MDFYRKKKEIGYWYRIDGIKEFFENDLDENNKTSLYNYIFLKNHYSAEANPNFLPFIKYLIQLNNIRKIYIVGYTTDYCVKAAVESFMKINNGNGLEFQLYLVEDAITGIDEETSREVIKKAEKKGVKIIKTQDIIDKF